MPETVLIPALEKAVVHTLLYFDLFQHPLSSEEVHRFALGEGMSAEETDRMLEHLVSEGKLFRLGSFFSLRNNPDHLTRRQERNRRADRLLPMAFRLARFIGAFPFVRAVFASGSLSKHCMDADSDIDFFIITTPGRLWLARTLLVVFKKIILFNSHKYFCVNYFIDTRHLEIEEKNMFTAVETVTLLPLYGREWYGHFSAANGWAWHYFPNCQKRPVQSVPEHRHGHFKKVLEYCLSGRFGSILDRRAMKLTVQFWRKKFRHFDNHTFDNALKSRTYLSKHHPLQFQRRVLEQFDRNIGMWEAGEWQPIDPGVQA